MVRARDMMLSWEKIGCQLKEAKRFLEEGKIDEALYFVWLAAENLVNCLKVAVNGIYLKEHTAKTDILKDYFVQGKLKQDYSENFKKLSKYRIAAEFHPYTSIPRDYTKDDVVKFMGQIENLREEVGSILKKEGAL